MEIKSELVKTHIFYSIRAAIAEANGNQQEADKMRTQGNLRLITMSDEELRELSQLLSFPPAKVKEEVYWELKQIIGDARKKKEDWIGVLGKRGEQP